MDYRTDAKKRIRFHTPGDPLRLDIEAHVRRPLTLLHASDLHLHWSYREQSLWTVRGLATAAAEVHAEALLVAGDIFDTSEQPEEFVEEVAAVIHTTEVPVVMIPGNHDIRYSERERDALVDLGRMIGPRHRLICAPEGESLQLADGAIHVWGRGMPEHSPQNDPLQGVAAAPDPGAWSVVIAHGELVSPTSVTRSSPISLERHHDSLQSIHYIALGHHDESAVTSYGRTVVCYSGSASPVLGTTEYALVRLEEPAGASVTIQRLAGTPAD